ncbi:MAG TPA: hypothetical protein VFO55_11340 [Gemmatimonadaceae bacterium]|nr:hypothetical protein [Gemmatimonadaceae bacterium]
MPSNTNVLIRTVAGVALVAASASSSIRAQEPGPAWRSDNVVCTDTTPGAGTYARCALLIDWPGIRRGVDATVVGRPGIFGPIRLQQLVVGDSARRHAASYERNARRAGLLAFVGAALVVTGLTLADTHTAASCAPGYFCEDTRNETPAIASVVAGTAALIFSIPFQFKSQRAMARAVWWNNARFAH